MIFAATTRRWRREGNGGWMVEGELTARDELTVVVDDSGRSELEDGS